MTSRPDLRARLAADHPFLLDGALGTELGNRGVPLTEPAWSAPAILTHPNTILDIHKEYAQAGAECLTANTFRTHRRNLQPAGLDQQATELTTRAVGLAHQAANGADHPVWVAGSQSPLADCYRPQDVLDDKTLDREHLEMARQLAEAGVDLILVETQNTIREALAATRAAIETGLPVMVSFLCDSAGQLLSGESLHQAAKTVTEFEPLAILVNCLPGRSVPKALNELRNAVPDVPIGVYANTGEFDPERGWCATNLEDPVCYAEAAQSWRRLGAKLIGGCCGTTPDHIHELREVFASEQ